MTVDCLDDVHVLFGKTRNQIQTHLFGDGVVNEVASPAAFRMLYMSMFVPSV